jgi:type IV secretory pathway VirJ component
MAALPAAERAFESGEPFGRVALYSPEKPPEAVVLFLSGDGGWNLGVVDMARRLVAKGAAVAGIDTPRYLTAIGATRDHCRYLAGDLETLAHRIERELGLPTYRVPLLYGYSSGASIVYATLAQSHGTFAGGVSLGFCPGQSYRGAELCGAGHGALAFRPGKQGEIIFEPQAPLADPWVVLHGEIDQVCPAAQVAEFMTRTGSATFVQLPHVGHGFGVVRNWQQEFDASLVRLMRPASSVPAAAPAIAGLPLIEQPGTPRADAPLALMLTGDGGWAALDRGVAAVLNAQGVPVVGFSTLQYYWHARTPEESARDIERVLRHYLEAWHRDRVLLIGYSLGADVLPFIVSRLPPELRDHVQLVALLGLGAHASFEIHVADWLRSSDGTAYATVPELARLKDTKVLCIYGSGEADDPCPQLATRGVSAERIGDGHHMGGDYAAIAAAILKSAGRVGTP